MKIQTSKLAGTIVLAIVGLVLFPKLSFAKTRIYSTWGDVSCSHWNLIRPKSDSEIEVLGDIRWFEGYLTALNANSGGKDRLDDIDSDVFSDWIDGYCGKNSKMQLNDAAKELFQQLSK